MDDHAPPVFLEAHSLRADSPRFLAEKCGAVSSWVEDAGKFPSTFGFVAFDVFHNLSSVESMFAIIAQELIGVSVAQVAIAMLMSLISAFLAVLVLGQLSKLWARHTGLSQPPAANKLLMCVSLAVKQALITYFALFANTPLEFYLCVAVFGACSGVRGVLNTPLYTVLIPEHRKNAFLSLRGAMGSLVGWMGPLIFGIVNDSTDMRSGMLCLAGFGWIG